MERCFLLKKAIFFAAIWGCSWMLQGCTSEHEVLLEAARTGNTATRVRALEKLAAGKWDERTENVIVEALDDATSLVRRTAAQALAGRGMSVAWPLVRRLRDADFRVRVQAVKSLHTLPVADFIVVALMRALEDPSQAVRREVVEGFRRRGWTFREILVWQAFEKRMRALEGLSAPASMDRSAGLEQLGQLRAPQDFAFLLAAMSQTDAFLVQVAAKSLARGGEPEVLERLLEVGGPEPETLLSIWLEAAPRLDARMLEILSRRLPPENLSQILLKKNLTLPCASLANLADSSLVVRVEKDCAVDPAWKLDLRFAYLAHQGKADARLRQEALSKLDELSAFSLQKLSADPEARPAVAAWVKASWERYVFDFQKWIPERTWQAMDLVAPTEDAGLPKPPESEAARLLDAYRARSKDAVEETELFLPDFDVERFARQLDGLSGVKEVRETLLAMLPAAPPPLLAAALRVFSTLVVRGEKLPQAVQDAAASAEPAIQDAAISVLAAAGEGRQLLERLGSASPQQAEFILSQLEKTQDPGIQEELRRQFAQGSTARLALALARLGASGIRDDIVSLLAEDTLPALSGDRALLLEALAAIGRKDEPFLRTVESELWHPAPVVRCRALSFSPEETRRIWAQAAPEWEVRRCAAAHENRNNQ